MCRFPMAARDRAGAGEGICRLSLGTVLHAEDHLGAVVAVALLGNGNPITGNAEVVLRKLGTDEVSTLRDSGDAS